MEWGKIGVCGERVRVGKGWSVRVGRGWSGVCEWSVEVECEGSLLLGVE